MNEKGKFEFINTDKYFNETENEALFIKVNGKYAGFALVSNNTVYANKGNCIEEFWIMPKYRKGMFSFQVLKQLFNLVQGKIEFIVLKENKRWLKTLNYWISIIKIGNEKPQTWLPILCIKNTSNRQVTDVFFIVYLLKIITSIIN